jgi:hypothetical protein
MRALYESRFQRRFWDGVRVARRQRRRVAEPQGEGTEHESFFGLTLSRSAVGNNRRTATPVHEMRGPIPDRPLSLGHQFTKKKAAESVIGRFLFITPSRGPAKVSARYPL